MLTCRQLKSRRLACAGMKREEAQGISAMGSQCYLAPMLLSQGRSTAAKAEDAPSQSEPDQHADVGLILRAMW